MPRLRPIVLRQSQQRLKLGPSIIVTITVMFIIIMLLLLPPPVVRQAEAVPQRVVASQRRLQRDQLFTWPRLKKKGASEMGALLSAFGLV
jgi:hypothetical protein